MKWTPKNISKAFVWTVYMIAVIVLMTGLMTGLYEPEMPTWAAALAYVALLIAGAAAYVGD